MTVERGDVMSVLAVLAVPLAMVAAFPRGAIGFSSSEESPRRSEADAAIVFPDSSAVASLMRATKILPRNEGDRRRVCTDLLDIELPDEDRMPMMPAGDRRRPKAPTVVESGMPPYLPSRRAAPPGRIPAETDRDDQPFPRNELLKLN